MSKTYTTIQGDMWDMIAYKTLGSVDYTDLLIKANIQHHRTYIFSAGVELVIPSVETVKSTQSLPPWKQVNV